LGKNIDAEKTTRVATDVGGHVYRSGLFRNRRPTGRSDRAHREVDTTPPNFEQGVLAYSPRGEVDIADVDFFAHGTTVVINSLTERKGAQRSD
jgi:N-methylhydantoinase A